MNLLCRETGSALVESILVLVLLVPSGFAVVMLGKLMDLRQSAAQASRYGAWETTVYDKAHLEPSRDKVLVQRFFTSPTVAISSRADNTDAVDNALRAETLWRQTGSASSGAGNNNELPQLARVQIDDQHITASYHMSGNLPGLAGRTAASVAQAGALLDGVAGNEWGLLSSGPVSSRVNVGLVSHPWLGGLAQNCTAATCVQTHSAIMADGWSANGDEQLRRRVRSLVPASAMEPIGNLLALAGGSLVFPELKGLKGAFGHVDTTVLPEYVNP